MTKNLLVTLTGSVQQEWRSEIKPSVPMLQILLVLTSLAATPVFAIEVTVTATTPSTRSCSVLPNRCCLRSPTRPPRQY